VYTPDPEYSLSARKKKIQGIVVVSLTVDIAGQPRDLRVERKLDRELDEAAIDAVRQWKFEPATQDGRPVEVRVNVEVAFHLYK
jgi:protein TonB